ncbi:MAG: hypothetical protein GW921_04710, partial [Gallionella sp.]|nr:hypothetical protein [Gallionella sp.]
MADGDARAAAGAAGHRRADHAQSDLLLLGAAVEPAVVAKLAVEPEQPVVAQLAVEPEQPVVAQFAVEPEQPVVAQFA